MPAPRKEDAEQQGRQAGQKDAEADETPKSRQHEFSTYSENTDVEEANPPNGPFVVQELGEPKET